MKAILTVLALIACLEAAACAPPSDKPIPDHVAFPRE
jgi:hypothetical protein